MGITRHNSNAIVRRNTPQRHAIAPGLAKTDHGEAGNRFRSASSAGNVGGTSCRTAPESGVKLKTGVLDPYELSELPQALGHACGIRASGNARSPAPLGESMGTTGKVFGDDAWFVLLGLFYHSFLELNRGMFWIDHPKLGLSQNSSKRRFFTELPILLYTVLLIMIY